MYKTRFVRNKQSLSVTNAINKGINILMNFQREAEFMTYYLFFKAFLCMTMIAVTPYLFIHSKDIEQILELRVFWTFFIKIFGKYSKKGKIFGFRDRF